MQKFKIWSIIKIFNTMIVNSKVGGRAGRIFNFGGLHQIEWVGSTDEPLLDRDPVPQNGSRWLGCIALYCESRDSGF
jgi:hypothetical protein